MVAYVMCRKAAMLFEMVAMSKDQKTPVTSIQTSANRLAVAVG